MTDIVSDNLWPGLIAWIGLYVSDYSLTMSCARMYRGGQQTISVEGSFEITPYYQKDVDALRRFSLRFALALVWGIILLSAIWRLTEQAEPAHWPYLIALGGLILTELAVHMRHIRVLFLLRAALANQGVHGRIEYTRPLALRLSSVEFLAFAGMFLVMFGVTRSWFVLGGAVGCMAIAWKHARLRRKHMRQTMG